MPDRALSRSMGVVSLVLAVAMSACATAAPGTAEGVGASAGAAAGATVLLDPNIAAFVSASNQSEIQPSQLALQKSTNPQVREFAQRMIAEHTALEQQMMELLQAKGMAPQDNAISTQMKQNLQVTLRSLQARNGADFDLAYMNQQLASHQYTLNSLDATLIPSTRDPQLRALLRDRVRPAVASHLQQAEQIHHAAM